MNRIIVLDTGPLGLFVHSKANDESEQCNRWMKRHLSEGTVFVVPEIADYELRRELLRLRLTRAIITLETLQTLQGFQYLPINTEHMRKSAEFWATARQKGRPTADSKALDGDVIVAAQVASLESSSSLVVAATTNPSHLQSFVRSADWKEIGIDYWSGF